MISDKTAGQHGRTVAGRGERARELTTHAAARGLAQERVWAAMRLRGQIPPERR